MARIPKRAAECSGTKARRHGLVVAPGQRDNWHYLRRSAERRTNWKKLDRTARLS